jgi:UDP-glucuronate 4-epimerase
MERDFTYIDDITSGIMSLIGYLPEPYNSMPLNPGISKAPYRFYNIGKETPVNLLSFIEIVENNLARTAKKGFLPIQDGDVEKTWADIQNLVYAVNYRPKVKLEVGIERFIKGMLSTTKQHKCQLALCQIKTRQHRLVRP